MDGTLLLRLHHVCDTPLPDLDSDPSGAYNLCDEGSGWQQNVIRTSRHQWWNWLKTSILIVIRMNSTPTLWSHFVRDFSSPDQDTNTTCRYNACDEWSARQQHFIKTSRHQWWWHSLKTYLIIVNILNSSPTLWSHYVRDISSPDQDISTTYTYNACDEWSAPQQDVIKTNRHQWWNSLKTSLIAVMIMNSTPHLGFFPGTQMMIIAPTWVSDPGFWVSNVQIKNWIERSTRHSKIS